MSQGISYNGLLRYLAGRVSQLPTKPGRQKDIISSPWSHTVVAEVSRFPINYQKRNSKSRALPGTWGSNGKVQLKGKISTCCRDVLRRLCILAEQHILNICGIKPMQPAQIRRLVIKCTSLPRHVQQLPFALLLTCKSRELLRPQRQNNSLILELFSSQHRQCLTSQMILEAADATKCIFACVCRTFNLKALRFSAGRVVVTHMATEARQKQPQQQTLLLQSSELLPAAEDKTQQLRRIPVVHAKSKLVMGRRNMKYSNTGRNWFDYVQLIHCRRFSSLSYLSSRLPEVFPRIHTNLRQGTMGIQIGTTLRNKMTYSIIMYHIYGWNLRLVTI